MEIGERRNSWRMITDNFYYKPQYISCVWYAYIIGCMHWITHEVYSALPGSKQPDQAPTVCLPKITCELVFIGTPAACCHSAHLPASWKGCTGWPPSSLWLISSIADLAIVRGWHSPPSPPPHTHAPLSLAQKIEKRPMLDTPLPKVVWPFTKRCYN